ncbi:uncharacterized protein LOC135503000 [Lineus longissimus]|uniref:uncharacterized protein LOC135503000 n=1 Tax=Lineus longissimus TaxID=88925 RepID=UPI00315C8D8D
MANEKGFICRIFNVNTREYLYAADAKLFDAERRSVFTWGPGNYDSMCYWKVIPTSYDYKCDRKFFIYNEHQKEFLYAATQSPYDDDRRHVFTWRKNQERDDMMVWRIEPSTDRGVYEMYNVYQREYLYAAYIKNAWFDIKRRRVFTWRPGTRAGIQGHWKFEWLGENPLL